MKHELLETVSTPPGYTLAQAERLLPLIEAIAAEIVERHEQRRRLHRERAALENARTPEGLNLALAELDSQVYHQTEGIRHAIDELVELGLTVLRLHPVTIHIPGQSSGGPLVFCWQVGDGGIHHGHRLGEEDDPRRPLKVRSAAPEA